MKKTSLFLIACLCLTSLFWLPEKTEALTARAPISINGNGSFTNANGVTSGTGTQSDPYIIENWDIDATNNDGIFIQNTDSYFIIRNCYIHDGKNNWWFGIGLYNVTNGKIDNVTLKNNFVGIYFEISNNNQINCSVIYLNTWGVYLYKSPNNQITNTTSYNNTYDGFTLVYSSDNEMINITAYNNSQCGIQLALSSNTQINNSSIYNNVYGMYLASAANSFMRFNTLDNNRYNFGVDVYIDASDISYFYQDINTSNLINGKPIYYIVEQNDLLFDNSMSIGYLGIISCKNIIVANISITDNLDGVLFANTSYSTIKNVSMYKDAVGIAFYNSTNNQINNTNEYNNSFGIFFFNSSNNLIVKTNTYSNTYYGIFYYNSSSNQIEDTNAYNNSEFGIFLYKSSNINKITSTSVYKNSLEGIYIEERSNNNLISNSNVYTNSQNGIRIANSSSNQIDNCEIYNNSLNGINLDNALSNKITNSSIYENLGNGISLMSSSDNQIDYCEVYNNSLNGINLDFATNNKITNSSIYKNSGNGISFMSSSDKNIITDTYVYSNSKDGIILEISTSNQISSSQTYENSMDGIKILGSPDTLINNVSSYSNSNEGIYIYDSSNAQIKDSKSYKNQGSGLVLSTSDPKIKNSDFYNNSNYGIILANATNSIIDSSRIYNNTAGILIEGMQDNQLTNSSVYNNYDIGINIQKTANTKIIDSKVYENIAGIYIDNSPTTTITNTLVHDNYIFGISLFASPSSIFRQTSIENNKYNFGVFGLNAVDFQQDIDKTNTVNKKPIYYITSQSNLIFDGTMNIGYLALVSCTNILVENLSIADNIQGILLADTTYSTIINSSPNNNLIGISIDYSQYNKITNSTIYSNEYGIFTSSNNNLVYRNNFMNNKNHSYDSGSNSWDNGKEGNYWDDYKGIDTNGDGIGEIPYDIQGKIPPNQDRYPFVSPLEHMPPKIISTYPKNGDIDIALDTKIIINFSEPMNVLSAKGNIIFAPNVEISSYEWSNGNKTLTLALSSPLNSYTKYNVTIGREVRDLSWNCLDNVYNFSFRTKDTTKPIANAGGDRTVNEDEEIELNGTLSWDNVAIASYSWHFFDNGKEISLFGEKVYYTFNQPGIYVIELNVTDITGYWDIDIINITVRDITPPELIIISPIDGTFTNKDVKLLYSLTDNFDSLDEIEVNIKNGTVYSKEDHYTLTITAEDRAGNSVTKTINFTIDKTPPKVSITGVTNNTYYSSDVTPVIKIKDSNLEQSIIELNDEIFVSGTVITEEKNYKLRVFAIDKAGNVEEKTVFFVIDKTEPSINIDEPKFDITNKKKIYLNGSLDEYANLTIDDENVEVIDYKFSYLVELDEGENLIKIKAFDYAGNAIEKEMKIFLDTIPPYLEIIEPKY
ncbi:MAG: right-handed parallel beta-helix repeat-containing protein, partial [Candidatus Thermoplasmatota archaeon]